MKFWIKSALVIFPAMVLLGCGTSGEVQEEEMGAESGQATTSAATTSGIGSGSATSSEEMAAGSEAETMPAMEDSSTGRRISDEDFFKLDSQRGDELDDPNSLLATRVIYFDFDKSDVRSEFQEVIQAHAEYLASNPAVSITLEGHCDERGTREYNVALGERRANAVERMLTLQGVSTNQIRIISYGEERPAALGHTEDAWSLNRRAEIIYNR